MNLKNIFEKLKTKDEKPDTTIGKFENVEQKEEKALENFFQFLKENYIDQGEISKDDIREIAETGDFGSERNVEKLLKKLVEKGKASKEGGDYKIDFGISFDQDIAA